MFCRRCKYNLRNLSANACPECGEAFNPYVPQTYLTTDLPWWRRMLTRQFIKRAVEWSVVPAVLLVLVLSDRFAIRTEMGWIDAVTGSSKDETRWIFGFISNPSFEQSELEKWLVRREGEIQHDWRSVKGTLKNVWGRKLGSAHGAAPAIYYLDHDFMKIFITESTDEQIAQFIHTMRYGTEDQQRLAVNAVNLNLIRRKYKRMNLPQ